MALIKCPECSNEISDQADVCPKCGYELRTKNKITSFIDHDKKSWNSNYLLIILVVLVGGYFLFFNNQSTNNSNNNQNSQNNQNNNNQNNQGSQPGVSQSGNYIFNESGMYFEYPTTYKSYVDSEGDLYIAQNIDSQGPLIPYIMIQRYKNYTDPSALIKDFKAALAKEYPDAVITINMLSNYIGDKYVYGIQYAYTSNGHYVVDNRYAFLVNNRMYFVTTKEENVNTNEINNATRLIIETLKEVSN